MKPLEENYTRKEIDACNALHTLHTLHNSKEPRSGYCIRIRDSVRKAVSRYCSFADMTIGEFYEWAALTYMDINPVNGVVNNLFKPEEQSDVSSVEDRMTELICIGDLEDWIEERKQSMKFGGGADIHQSKIKKLRTIVAECKKINKRSERLNNLISEALSYVN